MSEICIFYIYLYNIYCRPIFWPENRTHTWIPYQPVNSARQYKQDLDLPLCLKQSAVQYWSIRFAKKKSQDTTYIFITKTPLYSAFLSCLKVFFFQPHSHRLLCIEWHDLQALLRFLSPCSHLMGTHALTKAGPPRFCSYLLFNNSISAG